MDIGNLIKQKRLQYKISMNELARRSGVGQSGLSEIEAGKRLPTFDNLERIVNLGFGVSLSDFFLNGTTELSPELQMLLFNAKTLTPEQLDSLNRFIQTLNNK